MRNRHSHWPLVTSQVPPFKHGVTLQLTVNIARFRFYMFETYKSYEFLKEYLHCGGTGGDGVGKNGTVTENI